MAKLTAEERAAEKIKRIQAKIQLTKLTTEKRAVEKINKIQAKIKRIQAKKEKTKERNKQIYELCLKNGQNYKEVALKFDLEETTTSQIFYNLKKKKQIKNQDD